MTSTQTLLSEIEKFLSASGMKDSSFGHKTVNDGKFVDRLRAGGSVTLDTAERIRNFIQQNTQRARPARRKSERPSRCAV